MDECGNSSTTEATFTITDTEVPTIVTGASDFEVVCDGDNNVSELLSWLNNNAGATATDNCNEISWTNNYGDIEPGACIGEGSVEVIFTVTDQCGNSNTTSATLTIIDDVAPVWTIDPNGFDIRVYCR